MSYIHNKDEKIVAVYSAMQPFKVQEIEQVALDYGVNPFAFVLSLAKDRVTFTGKDYAHRDIVLYEGSHLDSGEYVVMTSGEAYAEAEEAIELDLPNMQPLYLNEWLGLGEDLIELIIEQGDIEAMRVLKKEFEDQGNWDDFVANAIRSDGMLEWLGAFHTVSWTVDNEIYYVKRV